MLDHVGPFLMICLFTLSRVFAFWLGKQVCIFLSLQYNEKIAVSDKNVTKMFSGRIKFQMNLHSCGFIRGEAHVW